MNERTTKAHVSGAANSLAKRLGFGSYTVERGSKTQGHSWIVEFYQGPHGATQTVRLGLTADESFKILTSMTRGIDLHTALTQAASL